LRLRQAIMLQSVDGIVAGLTATCLAQALVEMDLIPTICRIAALIHTSVQQMVLRYKWTPWIIRLQAVGAVVEPLLAIGPKLRR